MLPNQSPIVIWFFRFGFIVELATGNVKQIPPRSFLFFCALDRLERAQGHIEFAVALTVVVFLALGIGDQHRGAARDAIDFADEGFAFVLE